MTKKNLIISGLGLTLIILAAGIWLYNWALGDTKTASEPISAPTLAIETMRSTDTPGITPAPQEINPTTASPLLETPKLLQDEGAVQPSQIVFEISQEESEVRFIIYELLRGSPKDVIGVSNQIAGQIVLDPTNLSATQVGEILVNARTLSTDDDRRNQAIRNRILFTDQYEYIRFQPNQLIGLSGEAVAGEPFNFQIAGELTIRDITQPVVFDVTITGITNERMVGSAKTVIQRADYDLVIPDVPFVANVGDEITLEIDLALEAK